MTISLALAALLAVAGPGVVAFTPQQRQHNVAPSRTNTALNAKTNDTFESVARRVAGTGAAFFAGVGFASQIAVASQIAFADPNALVAAPLGELLQLRWYRFVPR